MLRPPTTSGPTPRARRMNGRDGWRGGQAPPIAEPCDLKRTPARGVRAARAANRSCRHGLGKGRGRCRSRRQLRALAVPSRGQLRDAGAPITPRGHRAAARVPGQPLDGGRRRTGRRIDDGGGQRSRRIRQWRVRDRTWRGTRSYVDVRMTRPGMRVGCCGMFLQRERLGTIGSTDQVTDIGLKRLDSFSTRQVLI